RAAAVTGLGADGRADQAAHGALRVVHRLIERGDLPAVDAGGAAAAGHGLADRGVARAGDVLETAGSRDAALGVLRGGRVPDDAVVVAGEAAPGVAAQRPELRALDGAVMVGTAWSAAAAGAAAAPGDAP